MGQKELLWQIKNSQKLLSIYEKWGEDSQQEFLNFCTGVRGIKFLYDSFFKEVMNPESTPERLNNFLSLLLGKTVTVKTVLPNDSSRIADESSLLITDIVVELDTGSLANVEIQKIGYYFPGQRCACYGSDLLLRQYKRIRSEKGKKFSYKDIRDVYTIVLFEKSSAEFKNYPHQYLHIFSQRSNTGLEIDFLQKYLLIPLDIFLDFYQNNNRIIHNKLEAWLLFLSSDQPEDILNLIKKYPEFQAMYNQAYQMCRNVEDIMGLFSEELRMLDQNTVQLMIDDMQRQIETKNLKKHRKSWMRLCTVFQNWNKNERKYSGVFSTPLSAFAVLFTGHLSFLSFDHFLNHISAYRSVLSRC